MSATRAVVVAGAVTGFLAVGLGAFGAHALRGRIAADMLEVYRTGTEYQMAHALAMLAIGAALDRLPRPGRAAAAAWVMLVGVLLFSGSLYPLALGGARALGVVTPVGGVAFLLGWLLLATSAFAGGRAPRIRRKRR
ncbi:MAG: DUF423 domain-containing protein [Chthonomonadales bacterium]|nr:DUF423 domain-containing protein [Chthonomonadales bacterium]